VTTDAKIPSDSALPRRLCIIPRWAGGPERDFYPWLRAQLAAEVPPRFDEILSPTMPDPGTPTIAAWVSHIAEVLGPPDERSRAQLARTVLLGHSVGCQALLRYLADLPDGVEFAGLVCVAGWFAVDRPWPSILPWQQTPIADDRVVRRVRKIVVLLSDNDPFTADHAATAAAFQARLGAEVVFAPGRQHFNASEEPAVLDLLAQHFTLSPA
jgi:predicted alpha/beta hydrolase family esterase